MNLFFDEEYCGKNAKFSHENDEIFEWSYLFLKNLLTQSSQCVYYQKEKSILSFLWFLLDENNDCLKLMNSKWEDSYDLFKLNNRNKLHFLFFLHNACQKTIDEKSQASIIRDSNPRSDIVHEIYNKKIEFGLTITSLDFLFLIKLFEWLEKLIVIEIETLSQNKFEFLNDVYPLFNIQIEYSHALIKIIVF